MHDLTWLTPLLGFLTLSAHKYFSSLSIILLTDFHGTRQVNAIRIQKEFKSLHSSQTHTQQVQFRKFKNLENFCWKSVVVYYPKLTLGYYQFRFKHSSKILWHLVCLTSSKQSLREFSIESEKQAGKSCFWAIQFLKRISDWWDMLAL